MEFKAWPQPAQLPTKIKNQYFLLDVNKTQRLIIFKMPRIQYRITWHMENQKNLNLHAEMMLMLEFPAKDFKAAIIKMI